MAQNAPVTEAPGARAGTATHRLAVLLDVKEVAKLLGCSPRHVYRLSDSARMPPPLKIGALARWRRSDVEQWVADGCPNCRRRAR